MVGERTETAIYRSEHQTGDSVRNLEAARKAAASLVVANENLSVTEEKVTAATRRRVGAMEQELARHDPLLRAALRYQQAQERINRLQQEGVGSAQSHALAMDLARRNYEKISAANDNAITTLGRLQGVMSVVTRAFGALGVAVGAVAIVSFVRDTISMAGELDDLSQTLGVTTDQLQAYRLSALESGASMEIADTAIRKYTKSVGEALDGNKQMQEAFSKLNLTAQDIAGDPGATLPRVIKALDEIKDVTQRAAIETALFSRSGQQLEQVLKSWQTPIEEQIAHFKELNLVISKEQIEAIDRAEARFGLFFQSIKVGVLNLIDFLREGMAGSPAQNGVGGKADLFGVPNWIADMIGVTPRNAPHAFKPNLGPVPGVVTTPKVAEPFGLSTLTEKASSDYATAQAQRLKEQEDSLAKFEQDYRESMARTTKVLLDTFAKAREADKKFTGDAYTNSLARQNQYAAEERDRVDAAKAANNDIEQHYRELYSRMLKDRFDKEKDAQDKLADEAKDYWRDRTDAMVSIGKDFWMEFAETGQFNVKDLFAKMKSWWAQLLYEMIIEGKLRNVMAQAFGGSASGTAAATGSAGGLGGSLFGANGVFGGGAFGGKAGQVGYVGGALSGAALIAGMLQNPNGNTRISSGLSGAASGAMMGSMILPGIGTAIGAIIGGIAGLIGGSDKPSDMRSVAKFGSNGSFSVFAQSAHESSDQTLGLAQQAGQAISDEIKALTAFGVTFTQKLSNIWIGARDQSTYQMVGGQRVSVGSVGNAGDLANDTLSALLKSATSSDPAIAAVLKSGYPDMLKALQFAQGITEALAQITDPLQYAIDIWKKEAQARLDMAAATGVSIDKVQQLNSALYQQIVSQQNAGAISGLTGLKQALTYGAMATGSPQSQYSAALADYEAAKSAALAKPTAESAAAFAAATQTFLPISRSFNATNTVYAAQEQGALSTIDQLLASLKAPTMPDLAPAIRDAAAANANQITGAVDGVAQEVSGLREEVRGLGAVMTAMMNRYATAA